MFYSSSSFRSGCLCPPAITRLKAWKVFKVEVGGDRVACVLVATFKKVLVLDRVGKEYVDEKG